MSLLKRIQQVEKSLQIAGIDELNEDDRKSLRLLHPKNDPTEQEINNLWLYKYHRSRKRLYGDHASYIAKSLS